MVIHVDLLPRLSIVGSDVAPADLAALHDYMLADIADIVPGAAMLAR